MIVVNCDMDLLGTVAAVGFYLSAIMVFVFRLMGKPRIGYWIGLFEFCLAIPLIYLLIKAPELDRPALYYVQVGFMLLWLIVELLLDYVLKCNFRKVRWILAGYVTLFFAGTGGMLGIASNSGGGWKIVSIILYLIMAVLAFVQRKATGM